MMLLSVIISTCVGFLDFSNTLSLYVPNSNMFKQDHIMYLLNVNIKFTSYNYIKLTFLSIYIILKSALYQNNFQTTACFLLQHVFKMSFQNWIKELQLRIADVKIQCFCLVS